MRLEDKVDEAAEKALPLFRLNQWVYSSSRGVPSKDELKHTIYMNIRSLNSYIREHGLVDALPASCSSGRFVITAWPAGIGENKVRFEITLDLGRHTMEVEV